ncbi:pap2 domain containing protein [Zymoseptoria brevis]|uniref:Pap2 domain containing protein n=1 Tax=Zymoseptoria brevis TaxID=1047168 RepID=A0A0F4GCL7_9PEZI|nr:pap2 domain containing protein [Zymoseptoria brevis]
MRSASNKDAVLGAAKHMGKMSKKLIFSYILDWIVIIALAAAGGGLNYVRPRHRPFTLLSTENSYPFIEESIPLWILAVVCLVVPAIIIAAIALLLVPGRGTRRNSPRSQTIRLKLWELEKGLAGLCLSLATALFITQGMKNMFGKPRPNMLARCRPDLDNISEYIVGGYGQDISIRWSLVSFTICTSTDLNDLDDAFRSFPSGHSSWSWAGLLYLTLFLCSKFAIAIPHLPYVTNTTQTLRPRSSDHELLPLHANRARGDSLDTKREIEAAAEMQADPLSVRNTAASPPNYLVIPALAPVGAAVYICSTRWAEYYHFGFDVIFGSLIGILTAWVSFRWYHLPISRGQGWAWGARSKDRAFAIGVGTGGYVGDEGWSNSKASAANDDARA